jgi:hypothetical protein
MLCNPCVCHRENPKIADFKSAVSSLLGLHLEPFFLNLGVFREGFKYTAVFSRNEFHFFHE